MKRNSLKYGFTTGACAAAAAKGAAVMLREQRFVEDVEVVLPRGETARFRLHGRDFTEASASCHVIKDAGDDPDVTNGAEIHATVTIEHFPPSPQPSPTRGEGAFPDPSPPLMGGGEGEGENRIIIQGGAGIGRVTKPGLAVPVGEWAINPVPRRMIAEAVYQALAPRSPHLDPRTPLLTPHVTISIPNGKELAKKTINARLGIIGGLSILGTTGIVKPISAQAWTDTIEAAIDVAQACGCETLVLSTGRTSELVAQHFFSQVKDTRQSAKRREGKEELIPLPFAFCPLPEESFIMMGDYVGHALRACSRKGVRKIVLAAQFAKLLKIACGHEQTHVASSKLDLNMLTKWLEHSPRTSHLAPLALKANTAREVLEVSGKDAGLIRLVCGKATECVARLTPGMDVKVLLAGYGGEVLYCR
jgi:cobalt-precorrin-5B (C1)-methyltransferase